MSSQHETVWPVRLHTDRLIIREPGEIDRADLVRLMTDPHAGKYLGESIAFGSRQALELSPLGLTWGFWIIAHGATDQMLGIIRLDYDRDELEVTFALLPEHVGNGYADEALRAIIEFARNNLSDDHMIAVVLESNKRLVSKLKSLNFTVKRGIEEFGSPHLVMQLPLRSAEAAGERG